MGGRLGGSLSESLEESPSESLEFAVRIQTMTSPSIASITLITCKRSVFSGTSEPSAITMPSWEPIASVREVRGARKEPVFQEVPSFVPEELSQSRIGATPSESKEDDCAPVEEHARSTTRHPMNHDAVESVHGITFHVLR